MAKKNGADNLLCFGDHICLYCNDTQGYLFSENTSSACCLLNVYQKQDRHKPLNIPNPQVITFQICIRKRYKLNKKWRKLKSQGQCGNDDETAAQFSGAQEAARAEDSDNSAEQRRMHGKPLKYGEIVQLKHLYTDKFIHVDISQTSQTDKNKLVIHLQEYDSKAAQLKILPRYGVNSEGEPIHVGDQVVFESVKSPGQFFHASFSGDKKYAELNLGVESSEFSIIRRFITRNHGGMPKHCEIWRATNKLRHREEEQDDFERPLSGGAVMQLHHKHLQAYLVCEGVYGDAPAEDVHLVVREANLLKPKTLYPPTSCTTYWQMEAEASILNGEVLRWEQHVRIRHLATRLYLFCEEDLALGLCEEPSPATVFKLHAMNETDGAATNGSFARLEHVVTGGWLHAVSDEAYEKRQPEYEANDMRRVTISKERLYPDAFFMRLLEQGLMSDFNYVSGLPLLLRDVIATLTAEELDCKKINHFSMSLVELNAFLKAETYGLRDRKRLMREMNIMDLLIQILQIDLPDGDERTMVFNMYTHAYSVLHTCTIDSDQTNCIYLSQHLDFFLKKMTSSEGFSRLVSNIMVQLIKDKNQVLARLKSSQIYKFFQLIRRNAAAVYIELLSALCACNEVAQPNNQTLIGERLLTSDKGHIFKLNVTNDLVYISRRGEQGFEQLKDFLENPNNGENQAFFREQLELFRNLCIGRNRFCVETLTRPENNYVTWDVAFGVLKAFDIKDDIKALFCELIICLFIDVGENTSVTESAGNTFLYDNVRVETPVDQWLQYQKLYVDKQTLTRVEGLIQWILIFMEENKGGMVACDVARNKLVKTVLRLMRNLVQFGYYQTQGVAKAIPLILNFMNGVNDLPFKHDPNMAFTSYLEDHNSKQNKSPAVAVHLYKTVGRFKHSEENQHIYDVKFETLNLMDLLFRLQCSFRLEKFVAWFKTMEEKEKTKTINTSGIMGWFRRRNAKTHWIYFYDAKATLKGLFEGSNFVDEKLFVTILLDLAKYQCKKLNEKALEMLDKHFNNKHILLNEINNTQILISSESFDIQKNVLTFMPLLRRLTAIRLHDDQVQIVCAILDRFTECCSFRNDSELPHQVGQNILVNHGIINVCINLVKVGLNAQHNEKDKYRTTSLTMHTLQLLRRLTRWNSGVQLIMFKHLDLLLNLKLLPTARSHVVQEIFHNTSELAMRAEATHIKKIIANISEFQNEAPQFMKALTEIVEFKDSGSAIKRNQNMVLKYFLEGYPKDAYVFELHHKERMNILTSGEAGELEFFINVVNLLVLCSKSCTATLLSFCRNLMSVHELVHILSNEAVNWNLKRPFLKFFKNVYLKHIHADYTLADTIHRRDFWKLLKQHSELLKRLIDFFQTGSVRTLPIYEEIGDTYAPEKNADDDVICLMVYVIDAFAPFMQEFSRQFVVNPAYENEEKVFQVLVSSIMVLFPPLSELVKHLPTKLRTLQLTVKLCMAKQGFSQADTETILRKIAANDNPQLMRGGAKARLNSMALANEESELALNARMRDFSADAAKLLTKKNTVAEQLALPFKVFEKKEYIDEESAEALPLTEDFQNHVRSFLVGKSIFKVSIRFEKAGILLRYLEVTGNNAKEGIDESNDELVVKTMQILRAMLHNEIAKVDENKLSDGGASKTQRRRLARIRALQEFLVEKGLVRIALRLMNKQDLRVVHEILALLAAALFNACSAVQDATLQYFTSTREESFFMVVRNQLQLWTSRVKLRKMLESAQAKEDQDHDSLPLFDEPLVEIVKEIGCSGCKKNNQIGHTSIFQQDQTIDASIPMLENDGDMRLCAPVELILKVISRLCDGQHCGLQEYMREQPDNLKTFNIPYEILGFLSVVYTSVNDTYIGIVTNVFDTLLEICSGNHENRETLMDNKIIDYINYILRNKDMLDACDAEDVCELQLSIAGLLIALLEESDPASLRVAMDIADTLDQKALLSVIIACYSAQKKKWQFSKSLICNSMKKKRKGYLQLPNGDFAPSKSIDAIGHKYFMVYNRVTSIHSGYSTEFHGSDTASRALRHYSQGVMTIEIIKNNHLQKVYFRVQNKKLIRDETKEKLKWTIDRSSPTNKIRDFMAWSKIIIKDVNYNKQILSNPISMVLTRNWQVWNFLVIFLSLVINTIMLVTWDAPYHLAMLPNPPPQVMPALIYHPIPKIERLTKHEFEQIIYYMGIAHNVISCILLVAYFLANNPSWPQFKGLQRLCSRLCQQENGDDDEEEEHTSSDDVEWNEKVFSFKTFYYLAIVAMSFLGTFYYGYCFAFHLLNIVTTNQLLQGVIKAVTQNGRSLIWVMVLGIVVLYIFALIGFGFYRATFNPADEMFCSTLYECFVTVIRYGLIGDLGEFMKRHPIENNFRNFVSLVAYQVTFFVLFTTIGLNIIFGIIVDTFSELRDLRYAAEKDMRETCFICSRESHDFEHHAKGFQHHVKKEHNMWAYIYYFIYLSETNPNDYTALDLFVSKLLEKERSDFFPLNQALSLANMGDDQEAARMETALQDIRYLVENKKKEEEERIRLKAQRIQDDWEAKHKPKPPGGGPGPDGGDGGGRKPSLRRLSRQTSEVLSYSGGESTERRESKAEIPAKIPETTDARDVTAPPTTHHIVIDSPDGESPETADKSVKKRRLKDLKKRSRSESRLDVRGRPRQRSQSEGDGLQPGVTSSLSGLRPETAREDDVSSYAIASDSSD